MIKINTAGMSTQGMLDERRDRVRVLDCSLNTRPSALSAVTIRRPGAYLLLYHGNLDIFRRARRPAGRLAMGALVEDGGYGIYAGSAISLSLRARRHVQNLVGVTDLPVEDLSIITLPTDTLAAGRYAEGILIAAYAPVLNCAWLSGFGSRPQGDTREKGQRLSAFSTLFPGRKGATGVATVTAEALRRCVVDHLAGTVPELYTVAVPSPPAQLPGQRSAIILEFAQASAGSHRRTFASD